MRRAFPVLVLLAGCVSAPQAPEAPKEGLIRLTVEVLGME